MAGGEVPLPPARVAFDAECHAPSLCAGRCEALLGRALFVTVRRHPLDAPSCLKACVPALGAGASLAPQLRRNRGTAGEHHSVFNPPHPSLQTSALLGRHAAFWLPSSCVGVDCAGPHCVVVARERVVCPSVCVGARAGLSVGGRAQVYVGNLVGGLVTEEALRQIFNSTMAAAFPAQMTPGLEAVVNVSMHSEGRYAFVELRSPEMATAALQLSGQVQLLGQAISVGRPSGYVDPTSAQAAAAQAAAALAAFKVCSRHTVPAACLLHVRVRVP
jgi:hypothetical protein